MKFCNTHFMSVEFFHFNHLSAVITSNLSLVNFVSGQIMICGNGTADIGVSCSEKVFVTGFSCHSIQTFWINMLHKKMDIPTAKHHHNLFQSYSRETNRIKRAEATKNKNHF